MVLTKEYRICMPLTVEEVCRIYQSKNSFWKTKKIFILHSTGSVNFIWLLGTAWSSLVMVKALKLLKIKSVKILSTVLDSLLRNEFIYHGAFYSVYDSKANRSSKIMMFIFTAAYRTGFKQFVPKCFTLLRRHGTTIHLQSQSIR